MAAKNTKAIKWITGKENPSPERERGKMKS
jgi:hypothetical protein